jgi:hypothetical protein
MQDLAQEEHNQARLRKRLVHSFALVGTFVLYLLPLVQFHYQWKQSKH